MSFKDLNILGAISTVFSKFCQVWQRAIESFHHTVENTGEKAFNSLNVVIENSRKSQLSGSSLCIIISIGTICTALIFSLFSLGIANTVAGAPLGIPVETVTIPGADTPASGPAKTVTIPGADTPGANTPGADASEIGSSTDFWLKGLHKIIDAFNGVLDDIGAVTIGVGHAFVKAITATASYIWPVAKWVYSLIPNWVIKWGLVIAGLAGKLNGIIVFILKAIGLGWLVTWFSNLWSVLKQLGLWFYRHAYGILSGLWGLFSGFQIGIGYDPVDGPGDPPVIHEAADEGIADKEARELARQAAEYNEFVDGVLDEIESDRQAAEYDEFVDGVLGEIESDRQAAEYDEFVDGVLDEIESDRQAAEYDEFVDGVLDEIESDRQAAEYGELVDVVPDEGADRQAGAIGINSNGPDDGGDLENDFVMFPNVAEEDDPGDIAAEHGIALGEEPVILEANMETGLDEEASSEEADDGLNMVLYPHPESAYKNISTGLVGPSTASEAHTETAPGAGPSANVNSTLPTSGGEQERRAEGGSIDSATQAALRAARAFRRPR